MQKKSEMENHLDGSSQDPAQPSNAAEDPAKPSARFRTRVYFALGLLIDHFRVRTWLRVSWFIECLCSKVVSPTMLGVKYEILIVPIWPSYHPSSVTQPIILFEEDTSTVRSDDFRK